MTSRRPPHKKSRQETQSIAAFFKPCTASSGATAAATLYKTETEGLETLSVTLRAADIAISSEYRDISVVFKKSAEDWIFDSSVRRPDSKKYNLLTNHLMPNECFQWPHGLKAKQKVYLSAKHLTGKYDAFKYSFKMRGLLCVPCVLFGQKEVVNDRNKSTPLGNLVTMPFRKYEKVSEKLNDHLTKDYQQAAQKKAVGFLKTVKDAESRIDNQLDDHGKHQVIENRKRLDPLIKTIIFCGRLGIALRGHWDDGTLDPDKGIKGQEGNFRALLAFRVDSGDNTLKEHLVTANRKATYISQVVQNELIELCGAEVLTQVVMEIKSAKYFAIIADETTDSSGQEQLCLCIRYVNKSDDNFTLKEEFVGFVRMENLSAESVADQILSRLAELDITIDNCVGQGYDGAALMSGYISGVQTRVRQKATTAVYVHCASHCLNLVLHHSSQVPPVHNMFTTLSGVINFVNDSPKRNAMLDANLLPFCETRFIQRHDAILRFTENFEAIVTAMYDISEAISAKTDPKTKSKAQALLTAVQSSEFVVSLAAAKKVMSLTLTLSTRLQSPSLDLSDATEMTTSVLKRLNVWRLDDNAWVGGAFSVMSSAEQLAAAAGISIARKRVVGRQQHRSSLVYPEESDSDYFKRSIWLSYLDAVIVHMNDKFGQMSKTAFLLSSLLASKNIETQPVREIFAFYGRILGCFEEVLYEELTDYVEHRKTVVDAQNVSAFSGENADQLEFPMSRSVLGALATCPKRFVHVQKLLQIASTLPVTSCSAERCFSAMKILKSRMRSTMEDDRLNGLALMYIHSDRDISVERLIDQFALTSRKLEFTL